METSTRSIPYIRLGSIRAKRLRGVTFIQTWGRLPGPADFIQKVAEDLHDGNIVVVGLPVQYADGVAREVFDAFMHGEHGTPTIVQLEEARAVQPERSVRASIEPNRDFTGFIWVNALDDRSAKSWIEYVDSVARMEYAPRLCVATTVSHAARCNEEKHLRRRLWFSYVTATDSWVLAERHCRHHGSGRRYSELKCALVSSLAKANLSNAHQMSKSRLRELVDTTKYSLNDIWAAQIAVLFPVLNAYRCYFNQKYSDLWYLPHERKGGHKDYKIWDAINLDLGDMISQVKAYNLPIPEQEMKNLHWLNRVRNLLAHHDILWGHNLDRLINFEITDFTD